MESTEFKDFYETQFPPELKQDFEDYLITTLSGNYSEDDKFRLTTAWISGYIAAKKHSNSIRRKMLSLFSE